MRQCSYDVSTGTSVQFPAPPRWNSIRWPRPVCPGTVETPSLLQRLRDTGDFDKAYKDFTSRQAMGRFGRPEELAALALYLASDESAFTTGQTHIIDGGWLT